MTRILPVLLLLSLSNAVCVAAAQFEFVDLFNGKNLDGWTQRNGTAAYRVDGDASSRNDVRGESQFVPLYRQTLWRI